MADTPGDGATSARELPVELVSELLRAVPRLVDRTRSQAELAMGLGRHLPCLGALLGGAGGASEAPDPDRALPGMHESVSVDVLSLLEGSDSTDAPAVQPAPAQLADPSPAAPTTSADATPTEAELPIQDYDSLAASQVVPRLATMSPDDLRSVAAYERAHRNRQTILNRVAQRLAG